MSGADDLEPGVRASIEAEISLLRQDDEIEEQLVALGTSMTDEGMTRFEPSTETLDYMLDHHLDRLSARISPEESVRILAAARAPGDAIQAQYAEMLQHIRDREAQARHQQAAQIEAMQLIQHMQFRVSSRAVFTTMLTLVLFCYCASALFIIYHAGLLYR